MRPRHPVRSSSSASTAHRAKISKLDIPPRGPTSPTAMPRRAPPSPPSYTSGASPGSTGGARDHDLIMASALLPLASMAGNRETRRLAAVVCRLLAPLRINAVLRLKTRLERPWCMRWTLAPSGAVCRSLIAPRHRTFYGFIWHSSALLSFPPFASF